MALSASDRVRIEELHEYGDSCLNKVDESLETGDPVVVHGWIVAADAAYRAADELKLRARERPGR
jgi:hypothetical protein